MDATIKSSFWSDPRVEELDAHGKLAALWLMSNSQRDLLGFTRATARRFTFETGLPPAALDAPSKGLPSSFQAPSEGVYFCVNFLRHQFGQGGEISLRNKVIQSAIKKAKTLPSPLQGAFLKAYPELSSSVLQSSPEPASAHPPSKPLGRGHSISRAEQSISKEETEESEESTDTVSQQELSAHQIAQRIAGLKPEWARPAQFSCAELHGIADSLPSFRCLDEADWKLLARYLQAHISQGKAFWQPTSRGKFIETMPDVLSGAHRWAQKNKIPTKASRTNTNSVLR